MWLPPLEKNTPSVLTNTWRAKWRGTEFWEGEQRCTQLFPQFLRICANPGSSYFALLIHCNHTYPPSAHPPQLASHPGWDLFQPITGRGQDLRGCLGWDQPLLESDWPLLVPPPPHQSQEVRGCWLVSIIDGLLNSCRVERLCARTEHFLVERKSVK